MNPLIETLHINQQINELLLGSIHEGNLADVAPSKGRSVAEQFAHIHNVRLMWLTASMPELPDGQNKIEKEQITKAQLISEMKKSVPLRWRSFLSPDFKRVESKASSHIPKHSLVISSRMNCITADKSF
jgi:uncharacterized damage-inducible protein DinB